MPVPAFPPASPAGVASLVAALEAALRRFPVDAERDEAAASVRRLAKVVLEGGGFEGRGDLLSAAEAVVRADSVTLGLAATGLVTLLQRGVPAVGNRITGVILVVEDDLLFARSLETSLATHGRRVVVVENARGARELLAQVQVDLVVLDLILPDGDGRSLLLELRSHPRTAGVPVFVVSARLGSHTKSECFALGADAYFEKPVDVEAFGVAVSARLERQARQSELARRDAVTGLPNRAAFLERAAQLRDTSPSDTRFALAVLDLDHFRWVEESWGRTFADNVLRRAGIRLAMGLRQAAVFARWDGAEFIALFAGRTAAEAAALVDQARAVLGRVDFRADDGTPFRVSFSAGVVDLSHRLPMDEAITRADRLRDAAKASGRDRVLFGEVPATLPPRTVVVVDDDIVLRRVVGEFLSREGFAVVAFPDGQAALDGLAGTGASLVISDIQMPRLDGLEFLAAVRNRPDLQHVPVMMLTALGDESHIVRAFELGADDYVTKPVTMRELLARARRLMRRPSLSGLPVA